MAFLTAKRISALAVELLTRQLVLPNTVSRVAGAEFTGGNGDTVSIRVPVPTTGRKQASAGATITYDTLNEVAVDVTVSNLYHATKITDQQLTLQIVNFARQVTLPQTRAVAVRAEDELAAVMNAVAADDAIGSVSELDLKLLEAREALGEANVPASDRYFAVSPSLATMVLSSSLLTPVDTSGSPAALREAVVGRYRGFTVLESNGLTPGTGIAYHSSGFAFANLPPATPRGAADSAVFTDAGISMRQIFQYDPNVLSDASVISTFAGAGLVSSDRVYKFESDES